MFPKINPEFIRNKCQTCIFCCKASQTKLSDLWQGGPGAGALCRHGEHRSDSQSHSGRSRIHVDPERHPGQDDCEQARYVHLDQVVAHLTLQVELDLNAGEFT